MHGSSKPDPAPLSDLPPASPATSPAAAAPNGRGVDGAGIEAGAIERAEAAAARTAAEHVASAPRGRAGKTGATSVAGVPGETLGDGAVPTPMADGDFPADLADGGPDIEDEFFQAGADMVIESAEEGAMTVMDWYALHQLRDADRAAKAAEKMRIKDDRRQRIHKVLVRLARKNPDRAAKLFGLLNAWSPGLQVVSWLKQFEAVRQEGQKLRETTAAPAASPAPTMPAVTGQAPVVVVTQTAAIPAPGGGEPNFKA